MRFDFDNVDFDNGALTVRKLTPVLGAALVLFLPLFYFKALGPLDFWWWMTCNNVLLLCAAAVLDRTFIPRLIMDFREKPGRKLAGGAAAALMLYVVFAAGDHVSRLLFAFADSGVANVYALKEGASYVRVLALMVFVFGPGEELFWRCFVQQWLGRFYGIRGVIGGVLLYTGIHVTSGNPMLILAAMVCGAFWAWLYARFRSPVLNIVSHTVWDVLVFLILPFR